MYPTSVSRVGVFVEVYNGFGEYISTVCLFDLLPAFKLQIYDSGRESDKFMPHNKHSFDSNNSNYNAIIKISFEDRKIYNSNLWTKNE
jgi:hypothetical protein